MIRDRINDEILLVLFDSKVQKKNFLDAFQENQKSYKKTYNYKIFDINEVESIDTLKEEGDTNIILLGSQHISIIKIFDSNSKVLLTIYHKLLFRLQKNAFSLFRPKHKFSIHEVEKYENYIEKRDPLEIINLNSYSDIYNSIFSMFFQFKMHIFENIDILKSNKIILTNTWKEQICNDIYILLENRILTSRLATAIYKSSTLKFFDSTTKIGIFYHEKLGIKSKTTQLPKIKPITKVKAYKLPPLNKES